MRFSLTIFICLAINLSANSQYLTHDVGFFIGTSSVQTDYGQRYNFSSSFGNSAPSVSIVHYMQFFNNAALWDRNDRFLNHLMIKTEFNTVSKTNFKHHGSYIKGNSTLATQLKAMSGTISMTSLGLQTEFYLKNLKDFMFSYSEIKWNPYVNIGLRYTHYKNTLNSKLGDWRQDITVLPLKYRVPGNLAVGSGGAFSLTLGGGTRYKLNENIDLATNFNWQYFFSDKIDGLIANVPENKNNEWMINFQVGIVYHLNFAGGILCK